MSYIAFDLDALNKAPAVARAAGLDPDAAIGGMARLWEFCWRTKTDVVSKIQIRGLMNEALIEPLEAFGFLAADADQWRVKGADRYLRVSSARSENGKKAAANGNLKRGSTGPTAKESVPTGSQQAPSRPPTEPQQFPSPSASSEQRTANSEQRTEEEATSSKPGFAIVYQKPAADPSAWTSEEFFQWAQWRRQEAGLVGEVRRPRGMAGWWSTAMLTIGGDIERMREAFYRFGESQHWLKATPPLPFSGFMSRWDDFMPAKVKS